MNKDDTVKRVLVEGGSPVALSDKDTRFIYNLLPVGEFYDKRYGRISITPEKLRQMAENFGKCPSYEVPVKLGHSDGAKSPGKIIGVEAKPDGLEVTMLVDAETAQAINDKQYRYMSAEYDENYHDKKTGEEVGAVLLGAALVNQPAHPYVSPLVLADDLSTENKGEDNNMTEVEELRQRVNELEALVKTARSEAEAKAKETQAQTEKISALEAENKELKEERKKSEKARNEAEVKSFCDKWAANGIPPAVLEKVKPLLLSEQGKVIKLSEDAKDDIASLKFFDELFDVLPKVPLGQISKPESAKVELSDIDKAIEHGKAIADRVKR